MSQPTRRNGAGWYVADQVCLRCLDGHLLNQRWLIVTLTIMVGTLVGGAARVADEQDLTELFSVSCPTVYRTPRLTAG